MEEGVPDVAPDVEVEFPEFGGWGADTGEGRGRSLFKGEREAWVGGVGFACFGGGQGVVDGGEFGVPGGLGVVFG